MPDQPPEPKSEPDLTALIGSRICHDLISPIGAIGNGVELLMMEPGGKSPELALISESVTSAAARLRFFRLAFGDPGQEQRIGRPEILSILADLEQGGRLRIEWNGPVEMPRGEARLLFLTILCLETALAWGGVIRLMAAPAPETGWQVQALAPRRRDLGPFWDWLTRPDAPVPADLAPATVHFALLRQDLIRRGRPVTLRATEDGLRLTL